MGKQMQFDYYYGIEAEQFSFYRVPRSLIKDERFKGLSSDAKLLYGLMLDRMSLSMKNGWLDEENRAYIIYTLDNVLNNGVGEKAQREKNKRMEEKPPARVSLKVRLAEKKAQVEGKSKEHDVQENEKKSHREM